MTQFNPVPNLEWNSNNRKTNNQHEWYVHYAPCSSTRTGLGYVRKKMYPFKLVFIIEFE